MRALDSYEDRLKMAEMHDDVLKRIDAAIKKKQSIEACWLCYACFESRITRTLEKISANCSKRNCFENHKVGIITKIDCLKRLRKLKYAGTDNFDNQLLGNIKGWCKERNKLVHALVTLNNYSGMDKSFLDLAKRGKPLVERLYQQTTVFRNKYYEIETMPIFPENAEEKCRLKKKEPERSLPRPLTRTRK